MIRVDSLDSLGPGVHGVRVPMPAGGLPYSLAYLLEDADGGVHVIDPGSPDPGTVPLLSAALDTIGRRPGDVRSILLTHLHADHGGAAGALRALTGAPILMHERERDALLVAGSCPTDTTPVATLRDWAVPADRRDELLAVRRLPAAGVALPDATVADGELLDIPGRRVRVLWTPGHTPGHLCFDDEEDGLLFTGDHVLPTINPGLGLGGAADDPIGDYLRSLRRVAERDRVALPGHEAPFASLGHRCAVLAEHHLRRAREVRDVLDRDADATVWEIARGLTWTGGWQSLAGFTLASALAQTAMHRAYVRSGAPLTW